MAISFASLASTPQGTYCFTRDGVSTFLPWLAFTQPQLSLGRMYWSQLAVIAYLLPSVNLLSLVTLCARPVTAGLPP
jgi:hypothetical protein